MKDTCLCVLRIEYAVFTTEGAVLPDSLAIRIAALDAWSLSLCRVRNTSVFTESSRSNTGFPTRVDGSSFCFLKMFQASTACLILIPFRWTLEIVSVCQLWLTLVYFLFHEWT